jgi:anaerobic ribonucleoside-triphosphate reductase activating protein
VSRDGIRSAGLVPFSTIDFPGRLAAVLFTQGCPLRCRYCHNPHLRRRDEASGLDWDSTLAWLRRRKGLLDAVVFSGGEPTIHPALADALSDVRDLGFATGLHTAGMAPERLARVLPLLDWVGLDVKAPFARYAEITGSGSSGARARRALDAVLASGIGHELRTTMHPALLGPEDLIDIAKDLRARGLHDWVLQTFRPAGCIDEVLMARCEPYALDSLLSALRQLVPGVVVR